MNPTGPALRPARRPAARRGGARRSRRGFSLAEVMVAAGIAAMVATIGALLLVSYARLARGVMVQEVVNGEARRALKLLELQVRSATEIATIGEAGDLLLPQPDGSEPRWSLQGDRLVYYEGRGAGRPEPGVVMMRDLAPTSRLAPTPAVGGASPRLVDVQLHLVDQRGADTLQVLTLNTRLAMRVAPATPEATERSAIARTAAHPSPRGD